MGGHGAPSNRGHVGSKPRCVCWGAEPGPPLPCNTSMEGKAWEFGEERIEMSSFVC